MSSSEALALVSSALEQLGNLQGASERAVAQLESDAAGLFIRADDETVTAFARATKIQEFESVVGTFKASILSTITTERHKKSVLRGRLMEKIKSIVAALHQGMQQELAAQLEKAKQRSQHRETEKSKSVDAIRMSKDVEIRDAVSRAMMDADGGFSDSFREAMMLCYEQQLSLMRLIGKADPKKYPDDLMQGWGAAELTGDETDYKKIVVKRQRELGGMLKNLVDATADVKDQRKMMADLERERMKTGDLSRQIAEMQRLLDEQAAMLAQMKLDHASEVERMKAEWEQSKRGMSKGKYDAAIEALKMRVTDLGDTMVDFDQALLLLEHATKTPKPSESETSMWCGRLDKRRKDRKKTKKTASADDDEAITMDLAWIDKEIGESKRDVLRLKEDSADKLDALKAMLSLRDQETQKQMDKLSTAPSGGQHSETQWDVADMPAANRPVDQANQAMPALKQQHAQTDQWKPRAEVIETVVVKAETALASCQTDGVLDPDANGRIDELLAMLALREAEINKLTQARDMLARLVDMNRNQPPPEVEPEQEATPVMVAQVDDVMLARLRGELRRAYALIAELEGCRPGSTPALFQALMTEHQFCLFCGALAEPPAAAAEGSLHYRLDSSHNRLDDAMGDGSFIKFWHQAPDKPARSKPPPGVGPAGWGGSGSQTSGSQTQLETHEAAEVRDLPTGARPPSAALSQAAALNGDRRGSRAERYPPRRPKSSLSLGTGGEGEGNNSFSRPMTAGSTLSTLNQSLSSVGGTSGQNWGGYAYGAGNRHKAERRHSLGNASGGGGPLDPTGPAEQMLARSRHPSAQAMARRLQAASWTPSQSAGGHGRSAVRASVPSAGTGLAEPAAYPTLARIAPSVDDLRHDRQAAVHRHGYDQNRLQQMGPSVPPDRAPFSHAPDDDYKRKPRAQSADALGNRTGYRNQQQPARRGQAGKSKHRAPGDGGEQEGRDAHM